MRKELPRIYKAKGVLWFSDFDSLMTFVLPSPYSIREATISDLDFILDSRRQMFLDMGSSPAAITPLMMQIWREYFLTKLPSHDYFGWIVSVPQSEKEARKDIAGGGLVIDNHPPSPKNPEGKIGYIMNVYVHPDYRHQGIARGIMCTILSWMQDHGIYYSSLHASEMGRTLYESLGYHSGNEMQLRLSKDS